MKCQYEHCQKDIGENQRSDAKFCCRNCKSNNRKINKYKIDRKLVIINGDNSSKWIRVIDLTPEQIDRVKMIRNGSI
jgi:hypothetical protein